MTQRGSASVLAASLLPLVLAVGFAAADMARLTDTYFQAGVAADAAALAAAAATVDPSSDPHLEASRYAEANGAHLVRCECDVDPSPTPRIVVVEVAIRVERWLIPASEVRASARAEWTP